MRIAVYGAGAIGGFLGVLLARAGHEVGLIARGAHLAAMRAHGPVLEMGGKRLNARAQCTDDPTTLGPQDYVLVAVKGPALPSIAATIAPLIGPETAIVTVMNGIPWWFFAGLAEGGAMAALTSVDPDGRLGRAMPAERVIGCVTHMGCTLPAPGVIRHVAENRQIIGTPGGRPWAAVDGLADALTGAGVNCEISARIEGEYWSKVLGNMSFAPISVLSGATNAQIGADADIRALCATMMEEAAAAGRPLGLEPGMSPAARIELGARLGDFKTSMLQDFERGRPLELDTIVAAVVEIGERFGVAMPATRAVLALARHKARLAGGLV